MQKINVIKVGGAVVEDSTSLACLIQQFATLPGYKILVHGGGRSATRIAAQLGIESHMVGGRRITDEDMLQVVTMVYGGLVNKRIVAALQAQGVNAVGLTGADMDIIRSHRRAPKMVSMDDGTQAMVDFGFVGDVDYANGHRLAKLILPQDNSDAVVPVVAPLTHDGQGNILNTNADTMAATVAKALTPHFEVTLTYCFEKSGVLTNPDDDNSVIPTINTQSYAQLKTDGIVSGGMIPKLDNAFDSIASGVRRVVITHYTDIQATHGTTIEQ
ncbi:MAG: acetylglutamate kinase [Bacteroidaceae bacterium]|nr:acetylglutamate kinase [Bacteroidaceae bacterium]